MRCLRTMVLVVVLIACVSAPLTGGSAAQGDTRPENPQIGLNFIRFFWEDASGPGPRPDPAEQVLQINTTNPLVQPDTILADFRALGIHAFRQFIKADLFWDLIEPQDDQWRFEAADAVLLRGDLDIEPVVTLFALQHASPTPPWVDDPAQFQKTLGPEAMDYLDTVIGRYGDVVRYWEIGNEMNHWRAADPGAEPVEGPAAQRAPLMPPDGFSPQEQGVFLAQVAAYIRERDPDAVIVMPGMGGLDDYTLNTWFAGVIEGGGTDWFDVVNYHFYTSWMQYIPMRPRLTAFLGRQGIADKPVWLTETGSSADPTLDIRTDYPNSPESQAADMFRRMIQAYGHGDALVMWHTYIGSPVNPDNQWRLYGIRADTTRDGIAQPSYYALQLLTTELIPFAEVETISSALDGANVYRIVTVAGATKYVVWGTGTFTVPEGASQAVSVVPDLGGTYTWYTAPAGDVLALTEIPVLVK